MLLSLGALDLPAADRLAVHCGDTRWTYTEFDDTCNALANGLAKLGVAIGDRVAVIARNSHAFAALRFAVARLGAVLVPVNFMLSAEKANYILAHSGATVLCTDSGFAELGRASSLSTAIRHPIWLPSETPAEPVAGLQRFDELLTPGPAPERELDGQMLAQIIYTSGTESRPKGAMLSHEAVRAGC